MKRLFALLAMASTSLNQVALAGEQSTSVQFTDQQKARLQESQRLADFANEVQRGAEKKARQEEFERKRQSIIEERMLEEERIKQSRVLQKNIYGTNISVPSLAVVETWTERAKKIGFQRLSPDEKYKAKSKYFDDVIAPLAAKNGSNIHELREEFMSDVQQRHSIKKSM